MTTSLDEGGENESFGVEDIRVVPVRDGVSVRTTQPTRCKASPLAGAAAGADRRRCAGLLRRLRRQLGRLVGERGAAPDHGVRHARPGLAPSLSVLCASLAGACLSKRSHQMRCRRAPTLQYLTQNTQHYALDAPTCRHL